tara:strand:+ start:221 stop:727 length:507 start_codon:yes stop_codon:yes gene_type:complete
MQQGKDHAREVARRIISELGISGPPVPVERIAKARGIRIQYAPLDEELSGMAFVKDGISVIGVNAIHHPNRQRFTIAHELAHHLLHRDHLEGQVHVDKTILKRDILAHSGTDRIEVDANAFAAELLMPEDMIAQAIEGGLDIADDVKLAAIAKRFRVSTAALQFRLMA